MDEIAAMGSDGGKVDDGLDSEASHGDGEKRRQNGTKLKTGKTSLAGRPNNENPPSSGKKWRQKGTKKGHCIRPATPVATPEEVLHGDGRYQKQLGTAELAPTLYGPGSEPSIGYYPVIRPQRTYERRQSVSQVRPQGVAYQLAPAQPMDRYAGLRPEPAMADGYYTVRQPARTYERQRPTSLVLCQDPVTQSPEHRPSHGIFTEEAVPTYTKRQSPEQDFRVPGPKELILHHPVGFKSRAKAEFAEIMSDAPTKSRTLLQDQGDSAKAGVCAATTLYLSSQLDKVKQDAKNGNEGAFLLLEQIQAFGKHRHQFSKKTLLMCARWKDRSYHSYNCARGTQLFALPTAVTLTKHCAQLGLSS